MLQKNDLLILLTELQDNGVEVSNQIKKVVLSTEIPIEVVKFINERRQLDLVSFYDRLRINNNHKKSDLYKNIMKEIDDTKEVIITLSAYALQVNLYSKHVENEDMFFKHSRVEEVTKVLNKYYTNYDITSAIKLIKLIKCDILALEYINNRRNENGERIISKVN